MSIWQTVQAILVVLAGVGGLAAGLGYAYGKFTEGKDNVLRADNDDLRQSRKDQDHKIVQLQQAMAHLEGQVKILSENNKNYEGVIVKALGIYFEKNPDVVNNLAKITAII